MTTAILVNPAAAGTGRRGRQLEQAAANAPGVLLERLDHFDALNDILKRFARDKVDLLIISGGDGTIQATVTALAQGAMFKKQPRLMLLPHGTTNMTAADIGFRPPAAEKIIQAATRTGFVSRATNVKTRTTVRLDGLAGQPPQHGFFFGCGAITRAVVKCQGEIHGLGLKGDWASGAILAYALFEGAFGRGKDRPDRLVQPTRATIRCGKETFGWSESLLFLATTLDRLVLGGRPFWNQAGEPLHITAIGYPPQNLIASTWRVMYGGTDRTLPEASFVSRSTEQVSVSLDTPVVLDGEIFEPAAKGVNITAGPEFEFICGL